VTVSAVTLRPAAAEDAPFLYRVYAGTRQAELTATAFTEEQKTAFLTQQFAAQDQQYHVNYAGATYDIIERHGEPVGRLYVARWPEEIRIIDISLLPEHCGQGVGTELLGRLLDEAARTRRRLTIHVEKANPARRLYERLGFSEEADRGVYVLMGARPQQAHENTAS
jgi:RimJ/RimL family protein N-acetyltransferase